MTKIRNKDKYTKSKTKQKADVIDPIIDSVVTTAEPTHKEGVSLKYTFYDDVIAPIKKTLAAAGILILLAVGLLLSFPVKAAPITGTIADIQKALTPTAIVLDVPETFQSDDPVWLKYGQALREMPIDHWTFRITGYGGSVMDANRFISSIEDAQKQGKTVDMDVVGPAYSAHAIITCYADNVNLREGASLMFHSVSYVNSVFFGLIQYGESNIDTATSAVQDRIFNQCVKKGILSKEDVAFIKNDGDVTLSKIDGKIVTTYSADPDRKSILVKELTSILVALGLLVSIIVFIKKV